MSETSTKPYLIRALHEWCTDNGYTPHIVVQVNEMTRVPVAHVRDGQITLNIGSLATNRLVIGNDFIEFQARFGGRTEDIFVPVGAVSAIYARETGAGMGFEIEESPQPSEHVGTSPSEETFQSSHQGVVEQTASISDDGAKRPKLTVVK
jgi:stringent starvation protein B